MAPDVVAVYFPSWHPNRHYTRWYGEGFSEWTLVQEARPRFPGHRQPLVPSWGAFDESDPAWAAREIDLAADHGITAFLFDWYWYQGEQFLGEALEDGFLRAPNRDRLKFCVMWANHTWGVWPAMRERYRGAPTAGTVEGQALAYDGTLLSIRHTLEDIDRAAAYCCAHYFGQPNYLTRDGQPVFALWYPLEWERQLGGWAGVAEGVARFRARCAVLGYPGVHLAVNIANTEPALLCWRPDWIAQAKAAGFDSVFGYNVARTHGYAQLTDAWPVVDYRDVVQSHRELFRACEGQGLPFHPVATVGFDNSPRWAHDAVLPLDFRVLGYEPIVVENTPARFGEVVRAALASIRRQESEVPFLLVNAWNEWTEGCYLLPEAHVGLGYLEALAAAVREGAPGVTS
jgi:hypothetical protein